MRKIIITDKPNQLTAIPEGVEIVNVEDFMEDPPDAWANYSAEYVPFRVCESINGQDAIVAIDDTLEACNKHLVAHHLISTFNPAIFYFNEEGPEKTFGSEDLGLFRNKGIEVKTKVELYEIFQEPHKLNSFKTVYDTTFDFSNYQDTFRRFLTLDRHQATNEWGAIKLLLNHGISLKELEATYQLPKTVYFKHKLKEFDIATDTIISYGEYPDKEKLLQEKQLFEVNSQKPKSILLVDDNAAKGWEFALKKLFTSAALDVKTSYEDADAIQDFSKFDLIFLDLRLPLRNHCIANIDHGFKLIDKIKNCENSLHIPLIVFTASQKASTLNDILEKGADAMYVKESPESSPNDSLDNYLDFISELNFQIEKGEHLKRYWEAILKIKSSLLPEIIDSGSLKLKSRIIERLEMFYGLIKKNYEDFTYNKSKFHFSSDVLSFITLWSTLNEIQECYYDKKTDTINIIWDYRNKKYTPLTRTDPNNPGSRIDFKYVFCWQIKNQANDIYFERINLSIKTKSTGGFRFDSNGDYLIDYDTNCYLTYSPNNFPYYSTRDRTGKYVRANTYQPELKLSFQIAFLILEKNQLNQSVKINDYLTILKVANEQRNKLYITHGEDASKNFHSQLEKDKTLPSNATENLFKLIAFLLTGDDSII